MVLTGKTAVVYGGGGFVGSAVATAFAQQGARVFAAGRREQPLARLAAAARPATITTAQVDITDADAVQRHLADVVAATGRLDICFHAATFGDVQGAPLAELPTDSVIGPVETALRTQHVVVRGAARTMVAQGSGVVMTVVGHGGPVAGLGTTGVTWQVVEALYRQWACELGPAGVRVVWLRTGGFRESILGATAYDSLTQVVAGEQVPLSRYAATQLREQELAELSEATMLKRLPSLAEAGEAAVFLASDAAAAMTAGAVNLTAGAVPD